MVQHLLSNEFEKLSLFMRERAEEKEKEGGSLYNTHFIESECARIRTAIRSSILTFGDDRSRSAIYIEFITGELILLSDLWYDYGPERLNQEEVVATGFSVLVGSLMKELNNLLLHLIENYPAYFHRHATAPEAFKDLYRQRLSQAATAFLSELRRKGNDKDLFRLLDAYLNSLNKETQFKVETFYQLEYLSDLTVSMHQLLKEEGVHLESQIYKKLLLNNFNHPDFAYLYIMRVKKEYQQAESYREELLEVATQLRILQQYPSSSRSFNPEAEPLKESLIKSFSEEIKYTQQLHELDLHEQSGHGSRPEPKVFFTVSITLEQLLFLFRLLIETGIIIIRRKSDLYDFVHLHIGTEERKAFSRGSLRNAFSSRRQATAKKIKDVLMEMVRLINQKYLVPAGTIVTTGLLC